MYGVYAAAATRSAASRRFDKTKNISHGAVLGDVLSVLRCLGHWIVTPAAAPWRAVAQLRYDLEQVLLTLQVRKGLSTAYGILPSSLGMHGLPPRGMRSTLDHRKHHAMHAVLGPCASSPSLQHGVPRHLIQEVSLHEKHFLGPVLVR